MTAKNLTPQAETFFDKSAEIMVYLYGRWQDERDYEHIDSYLQPLSDIAEKSGVQLAAMTKRPFGVKFRVGGKTFHAFIRKNTYQYKRIA